METFSDKNPTYTFILFGNFFLPTRLIEPTRLFNFGKFSYLHVISNCTLIKEVRVAMNNNLTQKTPMLLIQKVDDFAYCGGEK